MPLDFKPWTDEYGLICQRDPVTGVLDGGDSPMKTSFYFIGRALTESPIIPQLNATLRGQFLSVIGNICYAPGQYFRNPVKYSNPKDMSRDQDFPMLCAMHVLGAFGYRDQLKNAWITNRNRSRNGDLIGFDVWTTYFGLGLNRALYAILVLFGDLQLLLGVLIRCYQARDPDNVGDDMNLCLQLIMRRQGYSSPLSSLARHIYVMLRPYSYGSYYELCPTSGGQSDQSVKDAWARDADYRHSRVYHPVMGAWKWYWRQSTGAPPMAELWDPILRKYLDI